MAEKYSTHEFLNKENLRGRQRIWLKNYSLPGNHDSSIPGLNWNRQAKVPLHKPKEKNVEGHGIVYPNCLKKWGGRAVPWQGSPVPPVGGVPTIRRGPTMYIVLIS